MSRKLEKVRARKLTSFGVKEFSTQHKNLIAELALSADKILDPDNFRKYHLKRWHQMRDKALETKTFGDVLDGWLRFQGDDYDNKDLVRLEGRYQPQRWMVSVLVEAGVTFLDWPHMPVATVPPEDSSKEYWLQQKVRTLVRVTAITRRELLMDLSRHYSDGTIEQVDMSVAPVFSVTVSQLLQLPFSSVRRRHRENISTIRRKLYEVGFRETDGPFMQNYVYDWQEPHITVMKKLDCSEGYAKKLLTDMQKLGISPNQLGIKK